MKKLHSVLCTVLFFICSSNFAQEETVTLHTTTGDIEGTLSCPQNLKTFPLVLIISGSGPTDRNGNNEAAENNSLKFLAEELNKNGIASLRYDKRGIGKSRDALSNEADVRFDTYVKDAEEWISLLEKDKRVAKLIVAGHSEGSLIGMMAGAKNKKVSAFISLAGAGRSADEILKEQFNSVVPEVRTNIYGMIDQLKKGDTIANVPVIFNSIFRPGVQKYLISWFRHDPAKEIRKLKIPVLIVQGSTDIQVSEKDAELLAGACKGSELAMITNMNHIFKFSDTKEKEKQKPLYTDPDLELHKDLAPVVTGFIKKIK